MSTLDEKLKEQLYGFSDYRPGEWSRIDNYVEASVEQIKQAFIDEGWVQTKWEPTGPSLDLNKRASGVEK